MNETTTVLAEATCPYCYEVKPLIRGSFEVRLSDGFTRDSFRIPQFCCADCWKVLTCQR